MLAAMVIAGATVLLVAEDRLLTLGLHVGIAEYNARMSSRLAVDEVRRNLLTLTARARGVSMAPTWARAEPRPRRIRPALKVESSVGKGYTLARDIMT
jgi:hypothetical protein